MEIAIGDLVITDDGERWRIHSITRDGAQRSIVAVHLTSPMVFTADDSRLAWSEADGAWRLVPSGAI